MIFQMILENCFIISDIFVRIKFCFYRVEIDRQDAGRNNFEMLYALTHVHPFRGVLVTSVYDVLLLAICFLLS